MTNEFTCFEAYEQNALSAQLPARKVKHPNHILYTIAADQNRTGCPLFHNAIPACLPWYNHG
jgi:hypothetical protein